jgi:hypothetical protein
MFPDYIPPKKRAEAPPGPRAGSGEAPLPRLHHEIERIAEVQSDADIVVPDRFLTIRPELFGMTGVVSRSFVFTQLGLT